jgi:hypothetical protein
MTVTLLALGAERPAAATVDAALLSSCYAAAASCKHALIGQTCKVGHKHKVLTLSACQGSMQHIQTTRPHRRTCAIIDDCDVCRDLRRQLQGALVHRTWPDASRQSHSKPLAKDTELLQLLTQHCSAAEGGL